MKHDFSIFIWALEPRSLEVFLRKATQKHQRLLALALVNESESIKQRVQSGMSRNAFMLLAEEAELTSKKATLDKIVQAKDDLIVIAKQLAGEKNSGMYWPKTATKETLLSDKLSGKDESGYLRRVLEGAIFALKDEPLSLLVNEWMQDNLFLPAALSLPRKARHMLYREVDARYKEELGNSLVEGHLVVMNPTEALIARKALASRLRKCRKSGLIRVASDEVLVRQGAALNWDHYQRLLRFQTDLSQLSGQQLGEMFISFPLAQVALAIYEINPAVREQVYQKIGNLGSGFLRYQHDDVAIEELLEAADQVRILMLEYMRNFV
jgi:hypothetical protein